MPMRQWLYLGLALAGLVLTWYHNIAFALDGGGLIAFVGDAMVNHASRSLTLDVTVAAVTFVVWMWHETARLGMPGRWLYLLATFCVAVAFAFPFFLFMRERHRKSPVDTSGG